MGDINNPTVRLVRFAAITFSVCLADAVVGTLAPKPMPWVVIIPSAIPLLVVACIVAPLQRARRQ